MSTPGWGAPGWGAPPASPPPGAGYGGPPAYPAPYGYPTWYPPKPTEGLATGAFVCAIVSLVVCPVVPAVVALVLAQNARNRIDAAGGRLGGAGLVTAARVIAWIHLGLVMLVLLGLTIAGFVVGSRG